MNLLNVQDYTTPIPAEEIFGQEANRLIAACKKVYDYSMHPYEGCKAVHYSELVPVMDELKTRGETKEVLVKARELWMRRHPEEAAAIEQSRCEWEAKRDGAFRTVFGIARRHGVYLKWHGTGGCCCCPDQWEIYRGHEAIARICL